MTIFHPEALAGEHIVITGATGGIGMETAKYAAACGASVTITGRNNEKLKKLKKELESLHPPGKVTAVQCDLTEESDRHSLIKSAVESAGPITGLVNSAGVAGGAVMKDLTEEEVRSIMELNFTSTLLLTQLVYRQMIELGKGVIVNVSSLSGLRGTYGNSAYSASKFALTGFTQSLAVEAIEHNIRVNAVCPGFVNTEMARGAIKRKADRNNRSFEEEKQEIENNLPSSRLTEPGEVAHTIVFLLTDAAENVIGESVKISGGSVMR
ncbi:SDR family NAD(P)-dependent oxidoreductase [Alteribacter natronophilus]|uniref:SDR family NAD(P)-dependent oxidoreductase n=1 Tax=Alteribacter natronophilus TaxID=2583810 RepID=UPI00110E6086|nr:SDR family oxidoreductase [Alteribacter natronophilus]TMW73387.1 SDR family oxidoreductase [Alteribacter natronophilus]